MENHFYHLFDLDGEDVGRIAVTLPPLVIRAPSTLVCIVLRLIDREIGRSEAIVLHDLEMIVPRTL